MKWRINWVMSHNGALLYMKSTKLTRSLWSQNDYGHKFDSYPFIVPQDLQGEKLIKSMRIELAESRLDFFNEWKW
jgi:hypothetical protein